MEISKSVQISVDDQYKLKELAEAFRTIIDAMGANDSIETENHFWNYDQIAEVADILNDFAKNDTVFIC